MSKLNIVDAKLRKTFHKLDSPIKIQNFLDTIPQNFRKEEVYMSPKLVLRENKAHCIEGAMFAAAALWYHGHKPLLLDLRSAAPDLDHVIALYKVNNLWGAISKTNYPTMRYRDPVYRTVRELAISYFHEYFMDNGIRTLRSYSTPFDLSALGTDWIESDKDQFPIALVLDEVRHYDLYPQTQQKFIRKADQMERRAGELREWDS